MASPETIYTGPPPCYIGDMDKPKIFEGQALRLIFEDIERLHLKPCHTGTIENDCGEEQWDMYEWEHPYIAGLRSCYDRRTTHDMFFSWAYRP